MAAAKKMQLVSKPGKHGTLFLFAVAYEDACDHFNTGTSRVWAYDWEHAQEKFFESDDAEGWRITKISKVTS